MANTDISITQGWSDGLALTESQLNTAMSDIESWLNARNNGTDQWKNVEILATDADPLEVRGSSASGTFIIVDNTATSADCGIKFQLSAATKHTLFIDDSDGDAIKMKNTAGTVQSWDVTALRTRIADQASGGSAPAISGIAENTSGFYWPVGGVGVIAQSQNQWKTTDGTIEPITNNDVALGTASKKFSDVQSVLIQGSDYGFANGYIMREFPCTEEDVQTKSDEWMKKNANKGIQIMNDLKEIIAVIGRDGTIYAKAFQPLSSIL